MGAWNNFVSWLTGSKSGSYTLETAVAVSENPSDAALDLKLLTMASAVGYLATGLSLCNWRTIVSGREERGLEAFRLNNQPNPNMSKSEFCAKLLYKLAWENEAVIFSPPGDGKNLYIADHWNVERHGTAPDIYRDVGADNDNQSWDFSIRDIMHLRMHWTGLWPLISNIADEYQDMITTAYTGYTQQTGSKGVLETGAAASGTEEQRSKILSEIQSRFKTFYNSTSSVIALNSGYKYTPISTANRNTSEINDVVSLTDEFAERLGLALRVPVALLKGNAENTEHARTDLIMYGIRPIAQMIEQEYNAKRLGAADVKKGSRLYIDPLPIQLSNTESLANFCERMTSCGQYSIDELRELRGEPRLDTPEAQIHYITKNYGELGSVAEKT